MEERDYYEILGLPSTATNDELKQAYKKKAVKFHPDKNRSKFAEEAFKKIGTAYQTLIDPKKKKYMINMVQMKNFVKNIMNKIKDNMKQKKWIHLIFLKHFFQEEI
jgi:DnaJ-class molecular chaperone